MEIHRRKADPSAAAVDLQRDFVELRLRPLELLSQLRPRVRGAPGAAATADTLNTTHKKGLYV